MILKKCLEPSAMLLFFFDLEPYWNINIDDILHHVYQLRQCLGSSNVHRSFLQVAVNHHAWLTGLGRCSDLFHQYLFMELALLRNQQRSTVHIQQAAFQ